MIVREHFADTDAYYINLPASKYRRSCIEREFSGMFKSLSRVEPVATTIQDGAEFMRCMEDAYNNYNHLHRLDGKQIFVSPSGKVDSFKQSTDMHVLMQASKYYSLYKTTKLNLQNFLESGKQRVLFLEDDATCRPGFLDCDMHMPEADIVVWGGACSDVHRDSLAFSMHGRYKLKRIRNRKSAWFTTCYEVTKAGANAMLEAFDSTPAIPLDLLWMYAFDVCNAYACYPMGIVQHGISEVTGVKSKMHNEREQQ